MARILILIILFWLLYLVLKRVAASANQNTAPQDKPEEKIVQCARCGMHVPLSESEIQNGQVVCKTAQCNEAAQ